MTLLQTFVTTVSASIDRGSRESRRGHTSAIKMLRETILMREQYGNVPCPFSTTEEAPIMCTNDFFDTQTLNAFVDDSTEDQSDANDLITRSHVVMDNCLMMRMNEINLNHEETCFTFKSKGNEIHKTFLSKNIPYLICKSLHENETYGTILKTPLSIETKVLDII